MIPLLRKLALRTFGTLMPRTASKWFGRVLMTPHNVPRINTPQLKAPARVARLPYSDGWIKLWSFGKGPTVMLLHGWGGRAESMNAFVDPLVDAGYRVIMYDAPAHGASDGTHTNLIECSGAALQIGQTFGPLHGVIGHSFGSPTAALAARHGLQAGRFVLLGPPLSLIDMSMELGVMLGMPRRVCEMTADQFEHQYQFEWKDFETATLVSELDAPLLVIHDKNDRIVPVEHGAAVARGAPNGSLHMTNGLGHRGILLDPGVVAKAVEFLDSVPLTRPQRVPA